MNEDGEGKLFEIFNQIGKAGGCVASQSEAIGRLVSLAFRSGVEPEDVIKQLKGISCHIPVWHQAGKVLSCADAIAKSIEWHIESKRIGAPSNTPTGKTLTGLEKEAFGPSLAAKPAGENESGSPFFRGACPECGGPLHFEEGCAKCPCGYSDCG